MFSLDQLPADLLPLIDRFKKVEAQDPGTSPMRQLVILLAERLIEAEAGAALLREALTDELANPDHAKQELCPIPCPICRRSARALTTGVGKRYYEEVEKMKTTVYGVQHELERLVGTLHGANAHLEVFRGPERIHNPQNLDHTAPEE